MKSRAKTFLLSASLTLIFLCFLVDVYANTAYSNYLDSTMGKNKVQEKTHKHIKTKLSSLEKPEVIEEEMELEDWMFDCCFFACYDCDRDKIEPWMLDREFFKIHNPHEPNEELIEKDSEIKEWMLDFCPIKCSGSGIYTNYLEKEWVEKQNSLIL